VKAWIDGIGSDNELPVPYSTKCVSDCVPRELDYTDRALADLDAIRRWLTQPGAGPTGQAGAVRSWSRHGPRPDRRRRADAAGVRPGPRPNCLIACPSNSVSKKSSAAPTPPGLPRNTRGLQEPSRRCGHSRLPLSSGNRVSGDLSPSATEWDNTPFPVRCGPDQCPKPSAHKFSGRLCQTRISQRRSLSNSLFIPVRLRLTRPLRLNPERRSRWNRSPYCLVTGIPYLRVTS